MQAQAVLHRTLEGACGEMHAARRAALEAVVGSALRGRCLTVTGLGRSMRGAAQEKHCIKRADRLLSNVHLQREVGGVYGVLTSWLVGEQGHPVILIDWSDLDPAKRHQVIRAGLVVAGRALTLYEEVHGQDSAVKADTQLRFLQRLKALLPPQCVPVLVSDAGFRTPWFQAVERMKWYWVGRIRHRHLVQFGGQPWQCCKKLYGQARATPQCLGRVWLTRHQPHRCTLVLYRGRAQGRHRFNAHGRRARCAYSEKHARSAREPWLLGTNLPPSHFLARRVVRIYRARMQIEEAFRDLKCPRFGLALVYHRTGNRQRLGVLLLIAALAQLVLWLLGTAARQRGLARQYQANTERRRVVLSAVFLGIRILERGGQSFTLAELAAAWHTIHLMNAACWGQES